MHFIEHKYADDPTNWWVPNRACVEAMLRSSGFAITAHPEDEVYLCKRTERPQADVRVVSNQPAAGTVVGHAAATGRTATVPVVLPSTPLPVQHTLSVTVDGAAGEERFAGRRHAR